eukprot:jgi/Ulvmu1/3562/UM166_0016.1
MSFLHKLLEVFKFYFKTVVEESIRDNFVTVYELLDEVMDFGYPQFTEGPILREYIKTEAHKLEDFVGKLFGSSDVKNPRELPPQVTGVGATWRKEGIFYQRNEVFLDCIEQFNLMVNSKGVIVHSELKGTLQMKAYLSGMPECKLGLNDKTMFSRQGRGGRSVDLEDIKFHQCVRLTQFDENRQIVFTPPDGEFSLMSYRLSQLELTPPFWIDCQKEQHGSSRIELLIKIRSQFKQKVQAQSVEVAVPCPPDIRNPVTKQNAGSCAYDATEDCLRWTIKNFPSDKEFFLRANLHLPSVKSEETITGRGPPIRVTFEIPYNVPSGLQSQMEQLTRTAQTGTVQVVPAEYYDTDCGNKKSFARSLQDSPHRMAVMRSGTARFRIEKANSVTPFAAYHMDTAHKKSMSSTVRDSTRFGCAFDAPGRKEFLSAANGPDVCYDVKSLYNGHSPALAQAAEMSPVRYAMMSSKQARVTAAQQSAAPDVVYNTDFLGKQMLWTRVETSPILYANLGKTGMKRSSLTAPTSCPATLGPGSYDAPMPKDVRVSLMLNNNQMSSMASRAPRLATDKVDPTRNLGSTWRQEHDRKYWARGVTVCKAKLQR